MLKKFQSFLRDEEGATAVEYGLILGLIAVIIVATFSGASKPLGEIFTNITTALSTAAR
jgi:pilus assembly protein Flp/PilA